MDLLHIYIEYNSDIVPINCENLKQIHAGKLQKKYIYVFFYLM